MSSRNDQSSPANRHRQHLRSLVEQLGDMHGVGLDFGCGFVEMAETLRDEYGLSYIGISKLDRVCADLAGRGFESRRMEHQALTREAVTSMLGGRRVGVILVGDFLEGMVDPGGMLGMLRDLAVEEGCPLIVSVRNVAHSDLALQLLVGRWDYAVGAGEVPPKFTAGALEDLMRNFGWHEVARADVLGGGGSMDGGDWPGLAADTALRHFLTYLRCHADPWGETVRFVRAYLPGPKPKAASVVMGEENAGEFPFLSVVTRTQGKRLDTLRDVLLCLSAQECQDFELIVVGHRLDEQARHSVEGLIAAVWPVQPHKARLVCVDQGNRTTPLNVGFGASRGRYVAILDDDDVVLGHWVETFKELAAKHPGRVLRSRVVVQTSEPVQPRYSGRAVQAISGMGKEFLVDFDVFEHLVENRSPPVSLAFPRFAFRDFGIHFDEEITTAEDWDFLMRVVLVCGVADSRAVTGIYRKWHRAESSLTVHSPAEWLSNRDRAYDKMDAIPLLLPPNSTFHIRRLLKNAEPRGWKRLWTILRLSASCLRSGTIEERTALAKKIYRRLPLSDKHKWWLRNKVKRWRFFRRDGTSRLV